MFTPGYEEENKTKPKITMEIEGADEGVTADQAALVLFTGLRPSCSSSNHNSLIPFSRRSERTSQHNRGPHHLPLPVINSRLRSLQQLVPRCRLGLHRIRPCLFLPFLAIQLYDTPPLPGCHANMALVGRQKDRFSQAGASGVLAAEGLF